MLPKQSLNRTARAHVRELRVDHGIEPTLDEIIWLHELGKRVENPSLGDRLDVIGLPAKAGNVYLWPLTIMAAQWYHERALPWFGHSEHITRFCLAFALAHGRGRPLPEPAGRGWAERIARRVLDVRSERVLSDLVDRDEAFRAVKQWAGGLQCRNTELDAAIDAVLERADPGEDEVPSTPGLNLEEIAEDLASMTGTDPHYWLTQPTQRRVFRAYAQAIAIEAARQGRQCAPFKDALGDAIQDMRTAMQEIIKAHEEEEEKACDSQDG